MSFQYEITSQLLTYTVGHKNVPLYFYYNSGIFRGFLHFLYQ